MLVSPTFVYVFDRDSSLAIGNFTHPEYDVVTVDYNANDIPLTANTETADIVTVSDPREITKGEISGLVYIVSTNNKDESVILRFYGNTMGLMYETPPIHIPAESAGENALANYESTGTTIPAGEIISLRVESTDNDLAIRGTITASQLRLVRRNL